MAKADQDKQKELARKEEELAQREEELKKATMDLFNAMKGARLLHKDFDVTDPAELPRLMIGEIGKATAGIQVEKDSGLNMENNLFMEEPVTIHVHGDNSPGSLEVIVITVNGINQPIIRGRDQVVKRKYVEALARSRVTGYTQHVPDASRPEAIQMVPSSAMTYPFSVREDRNPKGRAWLDLIVKTPA